MDRRRQEMRLEQQRKMAELDKANADNHQELVMQTRRYNEGIARENARIRQAEKASTLRAKARANQEVKNFWAEERLATYGETSALGAHRVRTDHWRGFNASQRKAVMMENAQVVADKEARRERERNEKRAYAKQINDHQRKAELAENQAKEERKFLAGQQLATHLQHQREEEERKKKEKKTRQSLRVGGEFFASFGTTAR